VRAGAPCDSPASRQGPLDPVTPIGDKTELAGQIAALAWDADERLR